MPTSTATDPPDPTRRIVVVDRPGAVQTEIRVGQLAIRRDHQDYMPLNLAVKILGGEGGNRLQGVLRSDRGLTYGASAEMDAFQRSGAIVADTDTRTETTVEALRLTVDEFIRLQQEAVSERELDSAQAFLAGNFALTIETPDAIALKVLNAIFYGLDLKDLPDYPQQVYRVTTEDIQRVSKRVPASEPPGDRARRRRRQVRPPAEEGRLRELRAGQAGRARSRPRSI